MAFTSDFTAALYSLEVILSTLSSGILLLMLPTITVTALSETMATSPTIPLDLILTFSPTFSDPFRNSAIFLSFSSCSWIFFLSSSLIFPFLRIF